MNKSLNIAIFASGSGTNALNILEYGLERFKNIKVKCVVTDNEEAGVIQKVNEFNRQNNLHVPIEVIPFKKSKNEVYSLAKKKHEETIVSYLNQMEVDWLVLAGYMRILSSEFIDTFYDKNLEQSRILNIHPSLLPKYPGKDAYEQAYESGDEVSGATVHFVDRGIDTGTIIKQKTFKRNNGDSLKEFKVKGMKVEYSLYPSVLQLLDDHKLSGLNT